MGIKLINQEYCLFTDSYVREYICDTETDVKTLPKCSVGSTALVVTTNETYIVNTLGYWVKLGGGDIGATVFTINGKSFIAPNNTTWQDWIQSGADGSSDFRLDDIEYMVMVYYCMMTLTHSGGSRVDASEVIQSTAYEAV